jgi:UDP-N-acetylglucosamine 2-epimerase (non-hydrolysing)
VHREENVLDELHFERIVNILNKVADTYEKRVLVSTHPRTRKFVSEYSGYMSPHVEFHKPLNFSDYIALQVNAKMVVSDSGTITEESSILGFPAVNLRQTHERPEGNEEATVILTSLQEESVIDAINMTLRHRQDLEAYNMVEDYTATNISFKVSRLIQSYIEYVNRVTWHK